MIEFNEDLFGSIVEFALKDMEAIVKNFLCRIV